jgi:predicted XRE-type DNA-binding protein
MINNKNVIILYRPDNSIQLEVRMENDTVWLTQAQIAKLFGIQRPAITKHLRNIYNSGELDEKITCSKMELRGNDFTQRYQTKFYNLDAILSVGYRVNSINATLFRQWANSILKEYLLRGYAVNQRLEQIERRVLETEKRIEVHDKKIDFFVKTALPPVEGIFFDGQIFDAYTFASNLIKAAKTSIILIDNYVDENILLLLSKRAKGVDAIIYTAKVTPQLSLDLKKHHAQYPKIEIIIFNKSHDRFLVIDEKDVYLVGASLKDLGKKWFAFTKMDMNAKKILTRVRNPE